MGFVRTKIPGLSPFLFTAFVAATLFLAPLSPAHAIGDEDSRLRLVLTLEQTDFELRAAVQGLALDQSFEIAISVTRNGALLASKDTAIDVEFPVTVEKTATDEFDVSFKDGTLIVRYKNFATDEIWPHTATITIDSSSSGEIVNISQTIGEPVSRVSINKGLLVSPPVRRRVRLRTR